MIAPTPASWSTATKGQWPCKAVCKTALAEKSVPSGTAWVGQAVFPASGRLTIFRYPKGWGKGSGTFRFLENAVARLRIPDLIHFKSYDFSFALEPLLPLPIRHSDFEFVPRRLQARRHNLLPLMFWAANPKNERYNTGHVHNGLWDGGAIPSNFLPPGK